jgi:hypothetical protein
MTKKLNLRAFALAALLTASSVAMAAGPQGPGNVTLTNSAGNLWTAAIGDTPVTGIFTDVFNLSPNATSGSIAWGSVVNTAFLGNANITFTGADLNGVSLVTFSGGPLAPVLVWNVATLLPSAVSGPLTLTIHGINTGGGSYGGDINLAMAVPEPATYGMLLAGAGILGLMARRRKES